MSEKVSSPALGYVVIAATVLGIGWLLWAWLGPESAGERYDRILAEQREAAAQAEFVQERRQETAVAAARAVVLSALKDPASATFGPEIVRKVGDTGMAVCGSVNARNSFGGYAGAQQYVVHPGGLVLTEVDGPESMASAWARYCE